MSQVDTSSLFSVSPSSLNTASPTNAPATSTVTSKPKGRRNKRACDLCRLKKAKCDAEFPCRTCEASDLKCSYSTPKRKRGIPTGYLQKMEKTADRLLNLLGLLLEEDAHAEQKLLEMARKLKSNDSPECHERYKQNLQKSEVLDVLELNDLNLTVIRSGLKKTESKDYRVQASESRMTISNSKAKVISDSLSLPELTGTVDNQMTCLGPSSGFDVLFLATFQKLQLSKNNFTISAWKLRLFPFSIAEILDVYFTFFHAIFPMVNKTDLIRLAHSPGADKKSAQSVLLWTATFVAYNHMCDRSNYNEPTETRIMHDLTTCILECQHSVHSVQALLIQSIYFWGQGYWSNAWLIVGNAVRMAMDLGINVCTPDSSVSSLRTWKCCCIIDTLISGRLGRVPQITADDYFSFDEPETSEEWELWKPAVGSRQSPVKCTPEPYRVVSIFNQFHKINRLANLHITQTNKTTFYSYPPEKLFEIHAEMAENTRQWLAQTPDHVDIEGLLKPNASADLQLLPHRANLYYGYVSMYLMVHMLDDPRLAQLPGTPSISDIVQMCVTLLSNFQSRFPSFCLPSFEYFSSLTILIIFKDGMSRGVFKSFREMLETSSEARMLLGYLEELSGTWSAARVAYDYFMAMDRAPDTDRDVNHENTAPGEQEVETPSGMKTVYSNFLASMPNFGDISDLDLFNMRVCIYARKYLFLVMLTNIGWRNRRHDSDARRRREYMSLGHVTVVVNERNERNEQNEQNKQNKQNEQNGQNEQNEHIARPIKEYLSLTFL